MKTIKNTETGNIRTSNHVYEILHYCELSKKWQIVANKEFDFLADDMEETSSYFVYKNQLYNLSNFMRSDMIVEYGKNQKFHCHGIAGDSYFSGTAVEISNSCDSLKVAQIYN